MGSTRLPGKVLMDLAGKPLLERVVQRCRRAVHLDELVIATTHKAADDPIVELCVARNWACFRGSEEDVLERYYRVAQEIKADIIVRITADCPLIEPTVIDRCIKEFLDNPATDYASNFLTPRTFPRGLDVEVFSVTALERAWREDDNPAWREHVTPYIYRHPESFQSLAVVNEMDYSHLRWCVDTMEDLDLVRKIYETFQDEDFSWKQVLILLERHPDWLELNRSVLQKDLP